MSLNLIVPVICLAAFVGLIAVSRPRAGASPRFLENGLVQVLYPAFLLLLFVAGAGGLLVTFN